MDVDVKVLKDLRERTGAGIMDCKNALVENDHDIEKAIRWLREKGMAKAVKKAARISAEGVFNVILDGNNALVYEVNCETDFVASNAKFKAFVEELGEVLVKSGAKCDECALNAKNDKGETVQEMILAFICVIGENIKLRNVKVITKADDEVFGVYKHNGGKIAVVTTLKGGNAEVGKRVSMNVCANNPLYISRDYVDQEFISREKEIMLAEIQSQEPNKPAQIVEKMVEGRVNKELKEVCLYSQQFIMDNNITVEQYLNNNNASVVAYSRNVVGEGVQKKENNFVEEVMSQVK